MQAELLSNVYGSLYNIFLSSLYHSMETIPNLKVSEIQPYLNVLDHVKESGLITRYEADISARLSDLEDRVRTLSEQFYQNKIQQLQAAPGVNRALPLLFMTDELEKTAKQLDKRFPEPLVGYGLLRAFFVLVIDHSLSDSSRVDIVSLVVEVTVPLYIADLQSSSKKLFESSMNGPTPDVPIQDIFALYRRTKTLLSMFEAFCPK